MDVFYIAILVSRFRKYLVICTCNLLITHFPNGLPGKSKTNASSSSSAPSLSSSSSSTRTTRTTGTDLSRKANCSKIFVLPSTWKTIVYTSKRATRGDTDIQRVDKNYVSPDNKRFRSLASAERYLNGTNNMKEWTEKQYKPIGSRTVE